MIKIYLLFMLFIINMIANDFTIKTENTIKKNIHNELAVLLEQPLFEMNSEHIKQIFAFYLKNRDIKAVQVYDIYLNKYIYSSWKLNNKIYHKDMEDLPKTQKKINNKISAYIYSNNRKIGEVTVYLDKLYDLSVHEQYLLNKKELNLCIGPDSMPFEDFDENGKYVGLTSDYYNIFSKNLNIPINVVSVKTWSESIKLSKQRECDIISAMETKERQKYLDFTTPYLKTPIVIATNLKALFISDFKNLTSQKIGVPKNYAYVDDLKKIYPNINIIEVPTIKDGLKMVINGKLYGQIGTLASIGYYFQTEFTGELKIAGKTDKVNFQLGIGVRDDEPILHEILQNQIDILDDSFHNKVLNNWINIKYNKAIDYSLIYKGLSVIFVIGLFIMYKQVLLNKMNKQLVIDVKKEVDKNREKDRIMFHQSKLAAMGEMINNIAHQWRQPLNEINSIVMNIDFNLNKENIKNNNLDKQLINIENQTKYMSETIDNFRDFFKPDKRKEIFLLSESVSNSLNVLNETLKNNNIEVKVINDNDKIINSYLGEYSQVLIVILQNAKDALILNKIYEKQITIKINEFITIEDNAGGIDDDIINNIFEPYFTTKHASLGVGIGLYMSKMIIEESMDGMLMVENIKNGTRFIIKV